MRPQRHNLARGSQQKESAKPEPRRSGRECKKVLPDDARQVGRRIRVYRRKLRAWFAGSVAGVDQDYADRVQVEYDDGDKEWVELGDQPSRWEDDAADESDRGARGGGDSSPPPEIPHLSSGQLIEVYHTKQRVWEKLEFVEWRSSRQCGTAKVKDCKGVVSELDLSAAPVRACGQESATPWSQPRRTRGTDGAALPRANDTDSQPHQFNQKDDQANRRESTKGSKKDLGGANARATRHRRDEAINSDTGDEAINSDTGDEVGVRHPTTKQDRAAREGNGTKHGGSNTKARGKMGRPAKKKGLRGGVPKRKELATIGRRVKVYWPLEKQWFSGKVDRVLKKGRKAHVVYDDEDTGYLYLSDDGFQWLDEGEAGKPRLGLARRANSKPVSYSEVVSASDTEEESDNAGGSGESESSSGDEQDSGSDNDSDCQVVRVGGGAKGGGGKERAGAAATRELWMTDDSEEEGDERDTEQVRVVDRILACRQTIGSKSPATTAPAVLAGKTSDGAAATSVDVEYNLESYKGRTIKVWWSGDEVWYTATCLGFDQGDPEAAMLKYHDDEEEQTLCLYHETYVWLNEAGRADKTEMKQFEYLVKWKDQSHLHCSWIFEGKLMKMAKMKLVNFHEKYGWRHPFSLFDCMWRVPQRVIAKWQGKQGAQVLVKWTGLGYEHNTWEHLDTICAIAPEAVEAMEKREASDPGKLRLATRPLSKQRLQMLTKQPSLLAGGDLFPHQLEALNWLRMRWQSKTNVILADEMGLGKTVSTIAFLHQLIEEFHSRAPSLVVVPLSTLPNWMSEFNLWTPHLNVLEYHGSGAARHAVRDYELYPNPNPTHESHNGGKPTPRAPFFESRKGNQAPASASKTERAVGFETKRHGAAGGSAVGSPARAGTRSSQQADTSSLARGNRHHAHSSGHKNSRPLVQILPDMETGAFPPPPSPPPPYGPKAFKFGTKLGPQAKGTAVKFHAMVTTYECLLADVGKLKNIEWECIVVDEGHRLKSSQSKLYSSMQELRAGSRMLLTGTPLQNNLQELFNLMTFIEGDRFPSLEAFQETVADKPPSEQVEKLKSLVAPHLLRRVKSEVMKRIPPREERVVPVELTKTQRRFYRAVLTKNYEVLRGTGPQGKSNNSLLNVVMQLRKVCNHPFLMESAEIEAEEALAGKECAVSRQRQLVEASGKLSLLHKLLEKLRAGGHRVLVFSQMTRVLDILEEYCSLAFGPDSFERIDGSTPVRERQLAIAAFNAPQANSFVFLLSTRACGLGINLATADTVIIYDSDWNPHNDIQAINRAHRIGQEKRLLVYRLTSRATVEERILHLAKKKLLLERLFVQGSESVAKSAAETRKEMSEILWWGTEEVFADEDDPPAAGDARLQEGGPSGANPVQGEGGDDKEASGNRKTRAKSNLMVWDDVKIDKLLDRAPPKLKAGKGERDPVDEGGEQGGLLGSINVWDLRDGSEVTPLAAAVDDEDEEKDNDKEPDGKDKDWDGLLKDRFQEMSQLAQAKMGRGKRTARINYAEAEKLGEESDSDSQGRGKRKAKTVAGAPGELTQTPAQKVLKSTEATVVHKGKSAVKQQQRVQVASSSASSANPGAQQYSHYFPPNGSAQAWSHRNSTAPPKGYKPTSNYSLPHQNYATPQPSPQQYANAPRATASAAPTAGTVQVSGDKRIIPFMELWHQHIAQTRIPAALLANPSRLKGPYTLDQLKVLYTQIELFKLLRENRFHEARPLAEYLSLVVANIRIQ